MDVLVSKLDMRPTVSPRNLPRGVHLLREFSTYNHELAVWDKYVELLYQTSMGSAYICLNKDRNLKLGMASAIKLMQDDKNTSLKETKVYGVNNSLKNFQDLSASGLHPFVIARSGVYTERHVGKILDNFTGGRIQPTRLHRLMADRPALTFPYQPFVPDGYKRIKPAFVPPEVKMKYVTAHGTAVNELLLAGKIVNDWSDAFYEKVLSDVDYTLTITEGEKKGYCLSMLPLFTGAKLDVVSIPGVWMWGKKQADGTWKLAPELARYVYAANGRRRKVCIVFDNDSWRNPKVADALLRLCTALREAGAMTFVTVIPPGAEQKGIDDYVSQHCVTEEGYDFDPLLTLLEQSLYVDRLYSVSYPSAELAGRLKTLHEKAEEFEQLKSSVGGEDFSGIDKPLVDSVVSSVGAYLDPKSSDLNGGHYLAEFQALPLAEQRDIWAGWLAANPFRGELDRQLDRFIPGVFRGRPTQEAIWMLGQMERQAKEKGSAS